MADDTNHLVPFREPVGTKEIAPFIPADFPSVFRFAELLADSGDMVPKGYAGNPAKIATAIFFGYEIGLLPLQSLQSIAVINGKPSIYGDAALALVRGSKLLDDFEEYYEGDFFLPDGKTPNPNFKAVCKITRVGSKRPTISEFSIGDAMMAGLFNKDGPWRQYPKRMLKMRARGFGLRDEFTDVLRGLILTEEAGDIEPIDITPKRNEPPVPEEENGQDEPQKRTRGRPRKNQYEAEAAKQTKIDPVSGEIEDVIVDPPAGDTKQTEATNPVEKKSAEPSEEKPKEVVKVEAKQDAKPAATESPAPTETKISDLVPNIDSIEDDVKRYLTDAHSKMLKTTTTQELRAVYGAIFKERKLDPDNDAHLKEILKWHKARVSALEEAAAAQPENSGPPSPDGDEKPTLDFKRFVAELERQLSEEKDPASVNAAYSAIVEIPLKEGLISAEQETELKAIWAKHLERAEFDN